jgi:hypothetical protein
MVTWSSARTDRSERWRSATTTAARGSWLSVMSLRPESSNRTRADSVGGTSSTTSPAATSCWAQQHPGASGTFYRPDPRRERRRPLEQPLALPAIRHHPVLVDQLLSPVEHRGGTRPAVRVDPDDEQNPRRYGTPSRRAPDPPSGQSVRAVRACPRYVGGGRRCADAGCGRAGWRDMVGTATSPVAPVGGGWGHPRTAVDTVRIVEREFVAGRGPSGVGWDG